jgi:hypothetical protein
MAGAGRADLALRGLLICRAAMQNRGPFLVQAWGKRGREAAEGAAELSLLGHCADVAAVTEALLGVATIRRRMERLGGRALEPADIARLSCLALWHDLGKANVGFWSQKFGDANGAARRRAAGLDTNDRGHTAVVATLLRHESTRARFEAAFPLEEVLAWGDGALALFWAAISNHGAPLYCGLRGETVGMEAGALGLCNAWAAIGDYDPMREIAVLGEGVSAISWKGFILRSKHAALWLGPMKMAGWRCSKSLQSRKGPRHDQPVAAAVQRGSSPCLELAVRAVQFGAGPAGAV